MKRSLMRGVLAVVFAVLSAGFFTACGSGGGGGGGGGDGSGTSTSATVSLKLLAFDAEAEDWFGGSVAISGDYAIVGASGEDERGIHAGTVHIFHRTGTDTWDTGTKVVASDAGVEDHFGTSVAISGDYAIVGALGSDERGNDAGAAYIFYRTGTTWDAGTKIMASDAGVEDLFGRSVAISGDYAIVGALGSDERGNNAGAAYIFYRTGTTWDAGTKIMAPDAGVENYFGSSVAISGDYAIVGAWGSDERGNDAGAAYIFYRTGTTWDVGTKIMASDAVAEDWFGWPVAISGDYAIVGASGEDEGGILAGAAYIFHRTGTDTWDAGTKIVASDAEAEDRFGWSVAISGDYVIVGADVEDERGIDTGAVYTFQRSGINRWDAGTKVVAADAEEYDYFGASVAISGDYAIIGAPEEDERGDNAGGAYIYIF